MHLYYYGQELSQQERDDITKLTVANTVEHIVDHAFYGCNSLIHVTLPDTVRDIGDSAFQECQSLTEITLPQSIIHIGNAAFLRCESLVSIHLPRNITQIGRYCFGICTGLTNIIIPPGVTHIYDGAFMECNSLENVVLPDGLIHIGNDAFQHCESLSYINFPDSLMNVGIRAFEFCISLRIICVTNSSTRATSNYETNEENGFARIDKQAFSGCCSLLQVYIPHRITSIEHSAFFGCSDLMHVYIPESLIEIHPNAFEGCERLIFLYESVNPNITIFATFNRLMHINETDLFHDWLKSRYDRYPFLKVCAHPFTTIRDVQNCIAEHGICCIAAKEMCSTRNGFDLLLLNPHIGDIVFDIIASILLLLV